MSSFATEGRILLQVIAIAFSDRSSAHNFFVTMLMPKSESYHSQKGEFEMSATLSTLKGKLKVWK